MLSTTTTSTSLLEESDAAASVPVQDRPENTAASEHLASLRRKGAE